MSISETDELYRQRFKLWFNNAKCNHQAFYSIYRSRGVRKLVIPIGITRSERVNLLYLIAMIMFGERYKLRSSSLWSLLHSQFSSLLGSNTHIKILFSITISLHSSLNVRGKSLWRKKSILKFDFSNIINTASALVICVEVVLFDYYAIVVVYIRKWHIALVTLIVRFELAGGYDKALTSFCFGFTFFQDNCVALLDSSV